MKLTNYIKSGLLLTVMAGVLASCSNSNEPSIKNDGDTVTIRIRTAEGVSTRADLSAYTEFTPTISTGSKVDRLVYAVYDENGNRLDFFQTEENSNKGLGAGQNMVSFSGGETTLVLKVNRNSQYQILCWAQSSECDAYDTKDLTNVKVSYTKNTNNTDNYYPNNDELRDAFCGKSIIFSGSANDVPDIILKRPFAQINVGTTGADFRMSQKIPGGTYYTYSEITLKGVAQTYNVMTESVPATDRTTDVTFTLTKIPAYYNMEVPADDKKVMTEGEEFLLVDLVDDDGKIGTDDQYLKYKTLYPTMSADNSYLTEEFKYMSMCYVLVPGTKTTDATGNTITSGSTLEEVSLKFSGVADGKPVDSVNTSFTLTGVPVRKNFRTNILGGLKYFDASEYPGPTPGPGDPGYDPENPTTPQPGKPGDDIPEDVVIDDPSTLFSAVSVKAIVVSDFDGDNETQFIDLVEPAGDETTEQ